MKKLLLSFASILVCSSLYAKVSSETQSLPRSTPSEEGVSSEWIMKYIDAVEKEDKDQQLHSIMIIKDGKVITEGWWAPYTDTTIHPMWSVSKSFNATAVGFAISEGLIDVENQVISFFPDILPDEISPNLEKMKIKHLLTMSAGITEEAFNVAQPFGDNWEKAYLAMPVDVEPGTKFYYDSYASYMLSAIVQKVTGQKVIDYLRPRLFEPLGITGIIWEESPSGINTGGWGLSLKTEDMAKFGLLFLNDGVWNGKQVLPEGWVKEATTKRITKEYTTPEMPRDKDWYQGYCYQMWRCRHNAYRADGANGQYIIMIPDYNTVVVTTAQCKDMAKEIDQIWDYILPALQNGPSGAKADKALKERLQNLTIKQ